MHVTATSSETCPGPTITPPNAEASDVDSEIITLHSQVLFKNDRIYGHHLMRINYTAYDVRRAQDSINPSTDHRDIMLLSDAPSSTAHPFCYARVLGIFHANAIYNGPGLKDHQPRRLEFLWVRWFEVLEGHREQNAWKLDVVRFVPMDEDDAFGFVDPADVLRSCHLIPDFSTGKLHPDCQAMSRASRDAHDSKLYCVNRFVIWSTISELVSD